MRARRRSARSAIPTACSRCSTAASSRSISDFGGSAHSGRGIKSILRRFNRWETTRASNPRAASCATVCSAGARQGRVLVGRRLAPSEECGTVGPHLEQLRTTIERHQQATRPHRAGAQLIVDVLEVGATDDGDVDTAPAQLLDEIAHRARVRRSIDYRGAVPVEHDRFEAPRQRGRKLDVVHAAMAVQESAGSNRDTRRPRDPHRSTRATGQSRVTLLPRRVVLTVPLDVRVDELGRRRAGAVDAATRHPLACRHRPGQGRDAIDASHDVRDDRGPHNGVRTPDTSPDVSALRGDVRARDPRARPSTSNSSAPTATTCGRKVTCARRARRSATCTTIPTGCAPRCCVRETGRSAKRHGTKRSHVVVSSCCPSSPNTASKR